MSSNRYRVRNNNQHTLDEQEEQTPPRGFRWLPRDLQMEVLRHTAARFVVTNKYEEDLAGLRRQSPSIRLRYVSVIVRYEFHLERRRASGPEMHAKFTKTLDPAWKLTDVWRSLSAADQAEIENWASHVDEFESFNVLKFYISQTSHTDILFCFLRRRPLVPRILVEVAPNWSRFPRSVLTDVRNKMETVFNLPLVSV